MLRNPTYKMVVRDAEFLNDDNAMYNPNFNAERFFFFTNEARAKRHARDRKMINTGQSPSPSQLGKRQMKTPVQQFNPTLNPHWLEQYPDLERKVQIGLKDSFEHAKVKSNIEEAEIEIEKKYGPSGSSLSMSKQLLQSNLNFDAFKFLDQIGKDREAKRK